MLSSRHTNGQEPLYLEPASDDLICNIGGTTSGHDTLVAQVQPGDTIGMAFDTRIFHIGPTLVYMSKAPGDVRDYDGSGDWFKVFEEGAIVDPELGYIQYVAPTP